LIEILAPETFCKEVTPGGLDTTVVAAEGDVQNGGIDHTLRLRTTWGNDWSAGVDRMSLPCSVATPPAHVPDAHSLPGSVSARRLVLCESRYLQSTFYVVVCLLDPNKLGGLGEDGTTSWSGYSIWGGSFLRVHESLFLDVNLSCI